MVRWTGGAIVLSALAIVLGLYAQDAPFTIRVDVPLVSVDVIVRDADGRLVTNLNSEDFSVYEDGVSHDLRYFASVNTPRSLLLLLDTTGSTEPQRPFMFEAIGAFAKTMRTQDRFALASISENFQLHVEWRNLEPGQQLEARIPRSSGNSRLYEAFRRAVETFRDEKGRKGLLVLTDGRDISILTETLTRGAPLSIAADTRFREHVEWFRSRGIPIYFVALNTDKNLEFVSEEHVFLKDPKFGVSPRFPSIADEYLAAVRTRMETLADATGGRIYFPKTIKDLAALYTQIGFDLGASYSLGYAPINAAADGTERRIEVRVRGEGRTVTQSRDSYTSR